jgi:hypothetical protein
MTSFRIAFALGAFLAVGIHAASATTSTPSSTPDPALCTPQADAGALGGTLPMAVINYLSGISRSPFVHAYLIAHVAEHGADDHWMTRCAREFIGTDVRHGQRLRQMEVLSAEQILRSLRTAEEQRLREEQLRADANLNLRSIIVGLRSQPTIPVIQAYAPLLRQAQRTFCGGNGGSALCVNLDLTNGTVSRALAHTDSLEIRTFASDNAMQLAGATRIRLAEAQSHLQAAEASLATARGMIIAADTTDSGQETLAEEAVLTPDSTRALEQEVDQARAQVVRLSAKLDEQIVERDALFRLAGEARRAADRAVSELVRTLPALEQSVASLTDVSTAPLHFIPEQGASFLRLVSAPPPPTLIPGGRTATPTGLATGLTDFVIGRARQEMMLGYIAQMYRWMESDALLRASFTGTYDLMKSLASSGGRRTELSMIDAGRVPMAAWRASLASDMRRLPLNLLQNPRIVCGDAPACVSRFTGMRLVAEVGYRLVDGEMVLDVLGNAGSFVRTDARSASPEITGLERGVRLLAALAEAYQIQGLPLSTQARQSTQYPYLLSGESFRQIGAGQREAFVRLLVLRAVDGADLPMEANISGLTEGVARALRAMDVLVETIRSQETAPARSELVLRSTTTFLETALSLAPAMMQGVDHRSIERLAGDWRAIGGLLESVALHDYGLAMARTTSLLAEVAPGRLSRNMTAVSGLAVGLAQARNESDVRAAFEAVTAPAGSWQAKRNREAGRLSLTAFPGVVIGSERVSGANDPGGVVAGLTLPVGVEFQLLSQTKNRQTDAGCFAGVCSASLFLQAVDLGSILNYRINPADDISASPNMSMAQMISPGAHLSLGLGRSPVNLLLGGQWTPGLRSVTGDAGDVARGAFQMRAGLTMDLTLFQF